MTIRFNKKIYSEKAVKQAIKDYDNLADFSLGQKKNYLLVKIKSSQPEIKKVIRDEFSNYVLSLMKE